MKFKYLLKYRKHLIKFFTYTFIFGLTIQNFYSQMPGFPDTDFGTNGHRIAGISNMQEDAAAVGVQSDNKIVTIGTKDNQFTALRLLPDGTVDLTFGVNGFATYFPNHFGTAGLVQSDDKIVIAGSFYNPSVLNTGFAVARLNANGTLDPTFDSDGVANIDFGFTRELVTRIIVQTDGKIVVAGTGNNNNAANSFNVIIARFNSDGSLDNTFDSDGLFVNNLGSRRVDVYSMTVQTDGKIVVVGNYQDSSFNIKPFILRLNIDGSFDPSFGSGNYILTDIQPGSNSGATSVVIRSDGKILVGSNYVLPIPFLVPGAVPMLVRYNSDGSLDTTFGGNGIVEPPAGVTDYLLLQPDNKVIGVAGNSANGYSISRFNENGTIDTSFGMSPSIGTTSRKYGSVTRPSSPAALMLHTDGKLLVVGQDLNNSQNDMFVARFFAYFAPTAALVNVSGRVSSPNGRGVSRAIVHGTDQDGNIRTAITNHFGYYYFEELEAGQIFIFNVFHKQHQFDTQVVNLQDSITGLNFIAQS